MEYGEWKYATFMGVARELAMTPRAQSDVQLQYAIASRHGVNLDECTDEELELLGQMATEYACS